MRVRFVPLGAAALLLALIGTGLPLGASASGPATFHVTTGAMRADGSAMAMAFYPSALTVHRGDIVDFTDNGGEPHTVVFGAPTDLFVNPFPYFAPSGGSVFTGAPLNSGWLGVGAPWGDSIAITIDVAPGTYAFRCVLHPGMRGSITVVPDDQSLQTTDAQYQHGAHAQETVDLAQATAIATASKVAAMHASDIGGTGTEVAIGGGDGVSTVMRFFPADITIRVGETVTFVNRDFYTPHTVTFGAEPPGGDLGLIPPSGDPTHFDGTQPLNSGFLWTPMPWGTQFSVTFTAAGTFSYKCGLHDFAGMTGSVTVVA